MFLDDGQVTWYHCLGAAPYKFEHLLLAGRVEIVEENPSDTSSLVPMPDEEVAIAPIKAVRIKLQWTTICKNSAKYKKYLKKMHLESVTKQVLMDQMPPLSHNLGEYKKEEMSQLSLKCSATKIWDSYTTTNWT